MLNNETFCMWIGVAGTTVTSVGWMTHANSALALFIGVGTLILVWRKVLRGNGKHGNE